MQRPNEAILADIIVAFCRERRIPERFRVADIRPFLPEYEDQYIRTVLGSYCEHSGQFGDHVSRFRRVGRGLYELISN
jgi:hypothetical protein